MPNPTHPLTAALAFALLTANHCAAFVTKSACAPLRDGEHILFAPKVETPPVLDGKLTDACWAAAAPVAEFGLMAGVGRPAVGTRAKVCYDDATLFVAFICDEPNLDGVRDDSNGRRDVWPGDCVEVFLDPGRTRTRAHQLVASLSGARYDADPDHDTAWNPEWRVAAARDAAGGKWTAESAIPFASLGVRGSIDGRLWGLNLTRERVNADTPGMAGLSCWRPTGENFHQVHAYGLLYLGARGQWRRDTANVRVELTLDKRRCSVVEPTSDVRLLVDRGDPTKVSVALALEASGHPLRTASLPALTGHRVAAELNLKGVGRGNYTLRATALAEGRVLHSSTVGIVVADDPARAVRAGAAVPVKRAPVRRETVPLKVTWPAGAGARTRQPVRTGVPFARGALPSSSHARLLGPDGAEAPCQVKTLATWDAGESVKWLLVTFIADAADDRGFILECGSDVVRTPQPGLTVREGGGAVDIDAGKLRLRIAKNAGDFISALTDAGGAALLRGPVVSRVTDHQGVTYTSSAAARVVVVEEAGPVAAVVRVAGWYAAADGRRLNQYVGRVYAYANLDLVKISHTFVNTGNCEQYRYRSIALSVPLAAPGATRAVFALARGDAGAAWEAAPVPLARRGGAAIVQTGSNACRILGLGPAATGGSAGAEVVAGQRAGNTVEVEAGDRVATVAVRWLWQQHPAGLEVGRDGAVQAQFWSPHQPKLLDLRPGPYLENLEPGALAQFRNQTKTSSRKHEVLPEDGGTLRPTGVGMGKTHDVTLRFGADPATSGLLADDPPAAFPDVAYCCGTDVLGALWPKGERFATVETLLSDYVEGFYSMQSWRQGYGDGFGWFSYGDTLHQKAHYFHRFWSHMFYCTPRMFWTLYFRSGEARIRRFAEMNTRHCMDLDTGHYTDPERPGNRRGGIASDDSGLFHHYGFSDGGYAPVILSTTDYADYLCLAHWITGDERARDVALEVANAVKWLWQKNGPTAWGHRATGQGLKQVLALYELTWDPDLRPIVEHLAQQIVDNVRDDVTTGYGGAAPADFTLAYIFPAAIEYYRLTGSRAMARWIVRNASYSVRATGLDPPGRFVKWDGAVFAYRLTGDRLYLEDAYAAVMQWPRDYDATAWIGKVWALCKAPLVLAAAAEAGDASETIVGARALSSSEVAVYDADDRELLLDATVFGPYRAREFEAARRFDTPPAMVLSGPDGAVLDKRVHPAAGFDPWYARGGWSETFRVPRDGRRGVYRLRLTGMPKQEAVDAPFLHDQCMIPAWLQARSRTTDKLMARIETDGLPPGGRYGAGRFHFYLPKNAGVIRMEYQTSIFRTAGVLELCAPDGSVAAATRIPPQRDQSLKWFAVEATPGPEQRGKLWSVNIPGRAEMFRFRVSGAPPYFTAAKQQAFPIE